MATVWCSAQFLERCVQILSLSSGLGKNKYTTNYATNSTFILFLKTDSKTGMIMHAFNPSTQEAEAGTSL